MPRVALLQLNHEANAFVPQPVTVRDFRARYYLEGEAVRQALGQTRNWIGGIIQALDAAGAETAIGLCASCHPGGPVSAEAFAELLAAALASFEKIRAEGPVDAVILALHGAMAVQGVAEPDGELAKALRAILGPEVPIGVTLDFHANINPSLMAHADVVIGGKLYPHTDTPERGARCVALTLACLAERRRTRAFRLPLMVAMTRQETLNGPFAELVAESEAIAARLGLDDVCLMGGFPYADTEFTCCSVLVTGQDEAAMREAYRAMADAVRARLPAMLAPVATFPGVMPEILAAAEHGTVVVADAGDNPGGGGEGNRTDLLGALIESGRRFAFGFLVDDQAARRASEAGMGARLTLPLGIREDGKPLMAESTVERVGEMRYRNTGTMMRGELMEGGLSAVLRVGQGRVITVTERIQAYDVNAFFSQGIDIAAEPIVAVKSQAHFRASYTDYATAGIIVADCGGYAALDPARFHFEKLPTRILPLGKPDWDAFVAMESAPR
ncbi:M81 family metallopeptidase [Acetobacteraceae bacterium H6797]|nr:M81 family metallopeptidase [Acetobacteraceae bacterium H6797]